MMDAVLCGNQLSTQIYFDIPALSAATLFSLVHCILPIATVFPFNTSTTSAHDCPYSPPCQYSNVDIPKNMTEWLVTALQHQRLQSPPTALHSFLPQPNVTALFYLQRLALQFLVLEE